LKHKKEDCLIIKVFKCESCNEEFEIQILDKEAVLIDENKRLRRLLWLNHGHSNLYGDDGAMQCNECMKEYGFWDWANTPVKEIEDAITRANLIKLGQHIAENKSI
jgi:hypothetical protein